MQMVTKMMTTTTTIKTVSQHFVEVRGWRCRFCFSVW